MAKKATTRKRKTRVRRKAAVMGPISLADVVIAEKASPPTRKRRKKASSRKRRSADTLKPYKPRKAKKVLVGGSDRNRDLRYSAKRPGRRISATGGVYYEWRRNRADSNPSRKI